MLTPVREGSGSEDSAAPGDAPSASPSPALGSAKSGLGNEGAASAFAVAKGGVAKRPIFECDADLDFLAFHTTMVCLVDEAEEAGFVKKEWFYEG